jgi:SAM-dependent methyltransferase
MKLDGDLARVLACPRCRGPLDLGPVRLACRAESCGFTGRVDNGVLLFAEPGAESFFDARTEMMDRVVNDPGTRGLFYEAQGEVARRYLAGAPMILDVGCGGSLPYPRPVGSCLIGLDLSIRLLRQNKGLDVAIYGSATDLPVADRSVDRVVCFYAVHHFVGDSVAANRRVVERAFAEFGRVLRPGGQLLVFDLSPWWPFWWAQRLAWNGARRALGTKVDMFFWRAGALEELAGHHLGRPAQLEREVFRGRPLALLPAGVALSWLQVPRLLFPFTICLYRWQVR